MTIVVALEGLSFAGKTSSINYALDRLPHWQMVGEYHDLVDPGVVDALASHPAAVGEQQDRISTYLCLDRQRWATIQGHLERQRPVLMDRCHVSILVYSRALHACYGIGDIEATSDRYQEAIDDPNSPVRLPGAVVMLDVSIDVAVHRLQRLSHNIAVELTTTGFVKALVSAYDAVLADLDRPVHRIDADRPLPEVHERVLALLRDMQ